MNARTEFTMRQAFAVMWKKAGEPSTYDVGVVREWLEDVGWPTLFPGHCIRCHGFGEGRHPHNYQHGGCSACWKEEQEHEKAKKAAMMDTAIATWKIPEGNEPFTNQQIEDILNGKPIEEMKRLKNDE